MLPYKFVKYNLVLVLLVFTTLTMLAGNGNLTLPNSICELPQNKAECAAAQLAYKQQHYKQVNEILFNIADNSPNNSPAILELYRESIKLFPLTNDTMLYLEATQGLALTFENLRVFDSAKYYYQKTVNLVEQGYPSRYAHWYYNNAACFYEHSNEFLTAEGNFQKALNQLRSTNSKYKHLDEIFIMLNISDMYLDLNYPDLAKAWLDTVVEKMDKIEPSENENYLFYGYVKAKYLLMYSTDSLAVVNYLDSVINWRLFEPFDYDLASLYKVYFEYYLENNNLEKAKVYLDSIGLYVDNIGANDVNLVYNEAALNYFYKIKDYKNVVRHSYSMYPMGLNAPSFAELKFVNMIATAYYNLGDIKKAYRLKLKIFDSYTALKNNEIKYAKHQLKTASHLSAEQAKNEILQLEISHNAHINSRKRIVAIILILAILLFVLIVVFFVQRNKHQHNFNTKLQKEVFAQVRQLTATNNELKQANKELENFAKVTAHDLKTYAKNIHILAGFLATENNQEIVSKIQSNSIELNGLMSDVIDYTISNNPKEEEAVYDINDIVKHITETLKANIEEKQAQIVIENQLPSYYTNQSRLFLILKNLIENGIKYNESKPPIIKIRSYNKPFKLILEIEDNGLGIDSKLHNSIFEIFNRGQHFADYKGSGIGLAICKTNAEKLGGKIRVKSKVGKGSTFLLILPLKINE